jgi:hypothetical protein
MRRLAAALTMLAVLLLADFCSSSPALSAATAVPSQAPATPVSSLAPPLWTESPLSAESVSAQSSSPGTEQLCGAPPNPYHLSLCLGGSHVYRDNLPSDVCSYFKCINNFTNGTGYMVDCQDGMYSMSGGRQGACSQHGGVRQAVAMAATPSSTSTSSPIPGATGASTGEPLAGETVLAAVLLALGGVGIAYARRRGPTR